LGHPSRKTLRQRKKEKKEQLARRNDLNVLDLTPYNAVKVMNNSKDSIIFK